MSDSSHPPQVNVYLNGELAKTMVCEPPVPPVQPPTTATAPQSDIDLPSGNHSYRLGDLAYLRSGDKGDTANIGMCPPPPLSLYVSISAWFTQE